MALRRRVPSRSYPAFSSARQEAALSANGSANTRTRPNVSMAQSVTAAIASVVHAKPVADLDAAGVDIGLPFQADASHRRTGDLNGHRGRRILAADALYVRFGIGKRIGMREPIAQLRGDTRVIGAARNRHRIGCAKTAHRTTR